MMTPREAERKQAEIYRQMSADQKIDIAFGMWRFGNELNQLGQYGSGSKKTTHQSGQTA
jgi:hypothetical protein